MRCLRGTCEREDECPRAVPRVRVETLFAVVHVDAQPRRRDRAAAQLLLPELRECLQELRESIWTKILFGWCPHLWRVRRQGYTIGAGDILLRRLAPKRFVLSITRCVVIKLGRLQCTCCYRMGCALFSLIDDRTPPPPPPWKMNQQHAAF